MSSKKGLLVLALILTGFLIYALPRFLFVSHKAPFKRAPHQETSFYYYCPMHPTYISNRPGDCPICYMKLAPKPEIRERKILYYRHPMDQADTSRIPKKDSMGRDYIPVYEDEVSEIGGTVLGRAPLQISFKQQELTGVKLGKAEKRKLTKEILTAGRVAYERGIKSLRTSAPIVATVYEYELPLIRKGTPVRVHSPYFPDQELKGEVLSIRRLPDPITRAHQVWLRVEDPKKILRPQMYVDVTFEAEIGEVVAVPRDAVVLTGENAIVFASEEEGRFRPQAVQLGEKTKDFYEIKKGIAPGESIIISSNFLIDSESRLQAAIQGAVKEGRGHQHGG